MSKIEKYILNNGLELILYQDKTKHNVMANIFVKFGGQTSEIKIDNKIYPLKKGIAHFMEHLLIEHSIYGNSLKEFNKNHVRANGVTSDINTRFYIDCVSDIEENIVKLINVVNNSQFKEEDIDVTKKAIMKEKMMEKDKKMVDLLKVDYECLFKTIEYPNTLGEFEDIEGITYEDAIKVYETLYQPKNQIMFISGNFDKNTIIKLVEDTYNNINKIKKDYEIIKKEEPNEINIKEKNIKRDVQTDYVRLSYKVNIRNISNKDRIKLIFYLNYFVSYLLGPTSKVYNDLVDEKVCLYNINYFVNKIDDFFIVGISTYTNKHEKFIKRVEEVMKKKELNKEEFELNKKRSIISLIIREDSLNNMVKCLFSNILEYNYYEFDTIEDIENMGFDDYKKTINNLDFNNYCITKMLRKD